MKPGENIKNEIDLIERLLKGSPLKRGLLALIAFAVAIAALSKVLPNMESSSFISSVIVVFFASLIFTIFLEAVKKFQNGLANLGFILILFIGILAMFLLANSSLGLERQIRIQFIVNDVYEPIRGSYPKWTKKNLNFQTSSSWCKESCSKGVYYTYKAAERACKMLGEGWALPSVDDYKSLLELRDTTESINEFSYWTSNNPPMNFQVAGSRYWYHETSDHVSEFPEVEKGYYWTSTDSSANSLTKNFAIIFDKSANRIIYDEFFPRENGFLCKCIQK